MNIYEEAECLGLAAVIYSKAFDLNIFVEICEC
jgi:hypothetical protein